MNQEEINQAMREGGLVVAANAKLREQIIGRASRLIDGVQYVAHTDLVREINEIKAMLSRMRVSGRKYAVAVEAQIARSVMLSLLLIPERQADLPKEDDRIGLSESTKVAAELAKAGDDARRIAEMLWGRPSSVPTIEGLHQELSKLGDGGKLAAQLLMAPRTEDAKVYDSNGRVLVEIPAAPKSLPSKEHQVVKFDVRTVDTETGVAVVRVKSAAYPDGPAMKGLFDRRVRLAFDDEMLPGVAKLLELAQVTDIRIRARVGVTRGLSSANAKLDELRLAEVVDETETRKLMSRRLIEMHAITEELFPEWTTPSASELGLNGL